MSYLKFISHIFFLFLLVSWFYVNLLLAQDSDINWISELDGSDGYSIINTSDNKIVITGLKETDTSYSIMLSKIDLKGDLIWSSTIESSNSLAYANCVIQTPDSNFLICGEQPNYLGDYDPNILLIKTDSKGNEMWQKTYNQFSHGSANSIIMTSDSNYAITGGTKGFSKSGSGQVFFLKVDLDGDILKSKLYNTGEGNQVIKTYDENLMILTNHSLIKTNIIGDTIWTRELSIRSIDILETASHNYFVTGYINDNSRDISLIRLDSNGIEDWQRNYGGSSFDYGRAISQDQYGNIIVYAEYSNDACVLRYSTSGELSGEKIFDIYGVDHIYDGIIDPDGSYILTGGSQEGAFVASVKNTITSLKKNINYFKKDYTLLQNFPNPFNSSTIIKFYLSRSENVKITLFDLTGSLVKILNNKRMTTGNHEIKIDAINLSSGIYIYTIETSSFIESKRLVLVK